MLGALFKVVEPLAILVTPGRSFREEIGESYSVQEAILYFAACTSVVSVALALFVDLDISNGQLFLGEVLALAPTLLLCLLVAVLGGMWMPDTGGEDWDEIFAVSSVLFSICLLVASPLLLMVFDIIGDAGREQARIGAIRDPWEGIGAAIGVALMIVVSGLLSLIYVAVAYLLFGILFLAIYGPSLGAFAALVVSPVIVGALGYGAIWLYQMLF